LKAILTEPTGSTPRPIHLNEAMGAAGQRRLNSLCDLEFIGTEMAAAPQGGN
jgi:hypothetical protein